MKTFFVVTVTFLTLPLFAASIVVTGNGDTIADDGQCTLREALTSANSNVATGGCAAGAQGLDTIAFAIDTGAQTIILASQLLEIAEPAIVDGTTQPGFAGSPLVTIASAAGAYFDTTPTAFLIAGGGSTIRSLAITGFRDAVIIRSSNNVVESNTITHCWYGVFVYEGAGNLIVRNSMSFIEFFPILIPGYENDACDGDTGPNLRQNHPELRAALFENDTVVIRGTLNSRPNSTFTLDFYFDRLPDTDAGMFYLGPARATTTGCSSAFVATFPLALPLEDLKVTATATDAGNNTSRYAVFLRVVPALQVRKTFLPDAITIGQSFGTSRMTVAITNPALSSGPARVKFGEAYVAGIVNAPDPAPASTCDGTFDVNAGGSSLTFDGSIDAGTTCMISVNVTATRAGILRDELPAGAVQGTIGSGQRLSPTENLHAAVATLNVTTTAPLVVRKTFDPVRVLPGQSSRLEVIFQNTGAVPLTNLSFTDVYPAGLVNRTPSNTGTSCGGSTGGANGDTFLSFTGGTLLPGRSCGVLSVVVAQRSGTIVNTIPAGAVTTAEGVTNLAAVTSELGIPDVPVASEWARFVLAIVLGTIAAIRTSTG